MSIGCSSNQADRQNCKRTNRDRIPGHSNSSLQHKQVRRLANVLSTKADFSRRLPTPIAVAIIVRIIVSRITVGLVMKIPKGTMIGTVLTTTIKTVLMGTFVRVGQLVVESIMSAITVVFIVVGQCRHHRYTQQYDGSH